jgi:hypothetical protein
MTVSMRGRKVSERAWKGTFSGRAVVTRRGRVIDRCRLGRTTWRVSHPAATVDATSEPGDYIGQGQRYQLRAPGDRITVSGNRRTVAAQAAGFTFEFDAPGDRRLRERHYADARRYPFNDDRPGLSISGNGRGCNRVEGEFTVHDLGFDRRGRVRRLDVSFVHHCEHRQAPPMHGRITYRR